MLFAALALFLACAVSSASHGEEARVIKLGYILAPHSQLGAGADIFAAEVEKRTQGRYRIDQYPDAALGGEVEMMKGVQLGTVDMAFITGAPMPNFVPEIGVFGIPFLIRDAKHAYSVLDGPFGQQLLKKFEAQNIMALAWGENGMRHITNSQHPIQVPADLQGIKLRVPQSDVMVQGFDALGADTHPLAFPDVYGALQTGRFDGQENPIATITASKFYQVQKYLTLSGHIYDPAAFLMSKDVWDDMSPADRQAFVDSARLGGQASRKFAAEAEANGVALLQKEGMQIVTDIDKAKFADAMAPAMPAFEQKFGRDTVDAIRNVQVGER
ncbi:MAG TPA: DctP family TRAP transporter solute-binding subunit [Stellaceae bacterium]|jgi:tripartite ATP-independent transporter DctP family solute receptor|nr:DctP family TRAP transporter solute-binding subunit [Stellaceae bacterium]